MAACFGATALAAAGLTAAAIASIWYVANWKSAIEYVRISYEASAGIPPTILERTWSWLNTVMWKGLGWPLLLVAVIALVVRVRASIRSSQDGERVGWGYYLYFLLGGLPAIPVAIASATPPQYATHSSFAGVARLFIGGRESSGAEPRHKPSPVDDAGTLHCRRPVCRRTYLTDRKGGGSSRAFKLPAALISSLPPRPPWQLVKSRRGGRYSGRRRSPYTRSARAVVCGRQRCGCECQPPASARPEPSSAARLPLRGLLFLAAGELSRDVASHGTQPSVLAVYSGWQGHPGAVYSDRDRELIREFLSDSANGFTHRDDLSIRNDHYSVDFYSNAGKWGVNAGTELGANFSDQILLRSAAWRNGILRLRIRLLAPVAVDYKLMLHGMAKGQESIQAWDQYIKPSLTRWQVGEERTLFFFVPVKQGIERYDVQIGFFDERDPSYAALPLRNGKSFVSVDGAVLSGEAGSGKQP